MVSHDVALIADAGRIHVRPSSSPRCGGSGPRPGRPPCCSSSPCGSARARRAARCSRPGMRVAAGEHEVSPRPNAAFSRPMRTETPCSSVAISPKSFSSMTCSSIASSTGIDAAAEVLSVRTRFAAPAIDQPVVPVGARPARSRLRGEPVRTTPRVPAERRRRSSPRAAPRHRPASAAERGVELRAQLGRGTRRRRRRSTFEQALLDPAGVGDQRRVMQPGGAERHEFDVAHRGRCRRTGTARARPGW